MIWHFSLITAALSVVVIFLARKRDRFDLSKRRYRALVYMLASAIINIMALWSGSIIFYVLLFYVNTVGVILLLFSYGRPHMYGGWYNPTSILPPLLIVFGLFVEIFIVSEFIIYIRRKVRASISA